MLYVFSEISKFFHLIFKNNFITSHPKVPGSCPRLNRWTFLSSKNSYWKLRILRDVSCVLFNKIRQLLKLILCLSVLPSYVTRTFFSCPVLCLVPVIRNRSLFATSITWFLCLFSRVFPLYGYLLFKGTALNFRSNLNPGIRGMLLGFSFNIFRPEGRSEASQSVSCPPDAASSTLSLTVSWTPSSVEALVVHFYARLCPNLTLQSQNHRHCHHRPWSGPVGNQRSMGCTCHSPPHLLV